MWGCVKGWGVCVGGKVGVVFVVVMGRGVKDRVRMEGREEGDRKERKGRNGKGGVEGKGGEEIRG